MLSERRAGQFCLLNFRRAMLRPHFPQALFTKNENRPWVRVAWERAVAGGRPIESPRRAWGQMRTIANKNYSAQARRIRRHMIPINTSFPATARSQATRTQGFSEEKT